MAGNIKIKKKNLLIFSVIIILVAVISISFLFNSSVSTIEQSDLQNLDAETRFAVLSEQRQATNSCGGGKSYVNQLSEDGTRIRGSCCSAMVFHSYVEQTEGLEKYSEYEIIPSDPYDVSAKWAQEMIEYTEETSLNQEQQKIYNEAIEMSHEGGPCCCKCWHWYAYEGLAKHLIINEGFSSEQIAEIWDLSDACGGDGHHHEHG